MSTLAPGPSASPPVPSGGPIDLEALRAGRPEEGKWRRLPPVWDRPVFAVGVGMALFQIVVLYIDPIDPWFLRGIHLLFVCLLAFALIPARRGSPRTRLSWVDGLMMLVSGVPMVYVAWDFDQLIYRVGAAPTSLDIVVGIVAITVILEGTRRATGWALPILCLLFMLYALYGGTLPGLLAHRGYSLQRLVSFLFSIDGIYGMPLGASAVYVYMFVLFGGLLEASRIDRAIINLAFSVAGRLRGGPGKVSVISSALFGTVSGSSVANVLVDGVINIPLMKSTGFKAHVAGGIEAVTSTGGQIMPPVMGAAAFIMAEIMGVPYGEIAVAAVIPAILYYVSNYWMIDFEAAKTGLRGLPRAQLPPLGRTLRVDGYLLLPVAVLMTDLMLFQESPLRAVMWGLIAVLVLSQFRRESRIGVLPGLTACSNASRSAVDIALTCASAGIIVGVFSLTGLGLKIAGIIVALSFGKLWLALFWTMIVLLLLGMGMPTVADYAIAAAVAAPALIKLGAVPMAAHMFIFYYACISAITPPVALAAYAAAAVAGAGLWPVGFMATKIGVGGFIIPYMFVYGPALLMRGSWGEILLAFGTAAVGTLCLAAGVQGWLLGRATWPERFVFVVAALFLIFPAGLADVVGLGLLAVGATIHMVRLGVKPSTIRAFVRATASQGH